MIVLVAARELEISHCEHHDAKLEKNNQLCHSELEKTALFSAHVISPKKQKSSIESDEGSTFYLRWLFIRNGVRRFVGEEGILVSST